MKRSLLFIGFALLMGFFTASNAQTAQDVLNRMKAKYDATGAMKATFSQTMSQGSKSRSMSGTILMQKNKYRVETGDQTLVTDGKTTWAYSRQQKRVLVDHYQADENAFSPDMFFMKHSSRFNVQKLTDQKINGADCFQMKFTPKSGDAAMKETIIWVRKSDTMPIRLSLLDQNNTRTIITLNNVQKNPAIQASSFTFSAPKGVQVVDLR